MLSSSTVFGNWRNMWTDIVELPILLCSVAAVFVLAGTVKGFLGFGLPSVSIAILTPMVGLRTALVMVLFPTIASNLWQALFGGALREVLVTLWCFFLAAGVGTVVGAAILVWRESAWVTPFLGFALCVYSVAGLSAPKLSIASEWQPWLSPVVGALGGLVAGLTGLFLVGAIYLHWLGLPSAILVQALSLSFLIVTLALGLGLNGAGGVQSEVALLSAMCTLPALLGILLGQQLRNRFDEQFFRKAFLVALFIAGASMAWRG